MVKVLRKNTYSQLVKDITDLYDYARHALVEAYWQIRQAVQEVNQSNSEPSVIRPPLIPCLERIRASLHAYALVDKTKAQGPRGTVVVDGGFNI